MPEVQILVIFTQIFIMKILRGLLYLISVLTIIYLFGPHPDKPTYPLDMPDIPTEAGSLETYIKDMESRRLVKPENEARIIWQNDSLKNKTEYAVVYLHGFSASQEEGDPVHTDFARNYGCNLFLARLAEHGLDTAEALINLTADNYWESAKQALAIGKQLGQKVILMGTSTGGTQALQLAAAFPNDVAALVLMSPNIEINDPNAWILNNHWGLQLARLVKKGNYNIASDQRDIYKKHWYSTYRLEGTVALQEMLETSMNEETFAKIKQPLLLLYYYKDDDHQDNVVKVSAMKKMFEQVSTPAGSKKAVAVPNAGDHVMGSYIKSGDLETVKREITHFAMETLNMRDIADSIQ
jgi:pimeloyl-ACP methyl ester carboxylesterase